MNSKLIASTVVAIAALAGTSAFAQSSLGIYSESGYATPNTSSNVTRAQVQAEYLQARNSGSLPVSLEGGVIAAQTSPSRVTRAEVVAQTVQWAKAHSGEQPSYFN
jgi:Domain of unknown function (DUF4148)